MSVGIDGSFSVGNRSDVSCRINRVCLTFDTHALNFTHVPVNSMYVEED